MGSGEGAENKSKAESGAQKGSTQNQPATSLQHHTESADKNVHADSRPNTEAASGQNSKAGSFPEKDSKVTWFLRGLGRIVEIVFAGAVAYFAYVQCKISNDQWAVMSDQNTIMKTQVGQTQQQIAQAADTLEIFRRQTAPQVVFRTMDVEPKPFDFVNTFKLTPHFKNPGETSANVKGVKAMIYLEKQTAKTSEVRAEFKIAPIDDTIAFDVTSTDEIKWTVDTHKLLTAQNIQDIKSGARKLYACVEYRYTDGVGGSVVAERDFVYSYSHQRFEIAHDD